MKNKSIFILFVALAMNMKAQSWQWAKNGSGSADEIGYSVATDIHGAIYVTGTFISDTMHVGGVDLTNAGIGTGDMFLIKYDAAGNIIRAKRYGDINDEVAHSITTDINGNVYVTGYFNSSHLAFGGSLLASTGDYDIFTVKFDSLGNILWARSDGGMGLDRSYGITADANENVFITGAFYSPAIIFDTINIMNSGGTSDFFVAKYDIAGNVVWAKGAGLINAEDEGNSVCADTAGNVYITGFFDGTSMSFGSTILINPSTTGYNEIFVVKYKADGSVGWAKRFGGTKGEIGRGIAIDAHNELYITGYYQTATVAFGSTTLTNAGVGTTDIFIAKLDNSGTPIWAKTSGGTLGETGSFVKVGASNNVYITGYFTSSSILFGATLLANSGSNDIFVAEYDAAGNALFAKNAGGSDDDYSYGVATDFTGNIYVTGSYLSGIMSFGSSSIPNAAAGVQDMFIAKLRSPGTVGTPDLTSNDELQIYPNPVTNEFQVLSSKFQVKEIKVFDVLGQMVINRQLTIADKQCSIDISALSKGVYFVEIKTDTSTGSVVRINRKIIKQ